MRKEIIDELSSYLKTPDALKKDFISNYLEAALSSKIEAIDRLSTIIKVFEADCRELQVLQKLLNLNDNKEKTK